MRHAKAGRKLNRTTKHRRTMFSNMVQALIKEEKIVTTMPKAKDLRPLVERMVTLAKRGDLTARRRAAQTVRQPEVLQKLFNEFPARYKDRDGGYTRILRVGLRRGDSAEMAVIEFLPAGVSEEAAKGEE